MLFSLLFYNPDSVTSPRFYHLLPGSF